MCGCHRWPGRDIGETDELRRDGEIRWGPDGFEPSGVAWKPRPGRVGRAGRNSISPPAPGACKVVGGWVLQPVRNESGRPPPNSLSVSSRRTSRSPTLPSRHLAYRDDFPTLTHLHLRVRARDGGHWDHRGGRRPATDADGTDGTRRWRAAPLLPNRDDARMTRRNEGCG